MKTKILLSAFILFSLVFQLSAQIKLLNSGYIALGSTSVPTGYSLCFSFNKINIGAGGVKPTLSYDLTPYDPRIWSSSGKIVLFNTNTYTYNDLQVRTLYQSSDEKGKVNITTLSNALTKVKKLRGVSYNWQKQVTEVDKMKNYGFIAQEVEQVIPDVTITDTLGNAMLNYSAIIPYLVEAIKELSEQVESMEKQLASSTTSSKSQSTNKPTLNETSSSLLYQNIPNPFSKNTEIRYYLAESVRFAVLYIYDMTGNLLQSFPIQNKENGSIIVNASVLRPGMYLYSLIADGKEVDTKRMILTE